MIIKIENENNVGSENVFVHGNYVDIDGWYGLTYFEIGHDGQNLSLNETEFNELYIAMKEMKKRIDKLHNL